MLAFSDVTQFPTNGSCAFGAGESVQASTSAEHVITVERRNIRIASPELGHYPQNSSPDTRTGARAKPHATAPLQSPGAAPGWVLYSSPLKVSPPRESADMVRLIW